MGIIVNLNQTEYSLIKKYRNTSKSFQALLVYTSVCAPCDTKMLNKYNETSKQTAGFCYIGIDTQWEGFYKIGKTSDPKCKSRQSLTINPNYKIIYRTKDMWENAKELESILHKELYEYRLKNNSCTEWFNLSEEILNGILKKYNFVKLEELGIK